MLDRIQNMRDLLRRVLFLLGALEPESADALVELERIKNEIKEALK